MEFCKQQFSARTQNKEMAGLTIPVVITVYADRSFTFIARRRPRYVLLKATGIARAQAPQQRVKVGKVTEETGTRDRHAEM